MVYENLIWCREINPVGGVTSVIIYLVKKYKNYPITILYEEGDDRRLYEISKYAEVVKFTGQNIECKNLFSSYSWEEIEGHVKYEKAYNVVHANLEFLRELDKKPYALGDFDTLAVTKWAGDHCGRPYEVCPNPIVIEDKRALLLVSATRLCNDKGDIRGRMEILSRRLMEREIPFVWLCFTDDNRKIPGITFVPSVANAQPYLKMADFCVQLSTTEACCMTLLESLSLGTPMICTKIPSFYEQGANEHNSIFADFDMSNVDEVIDRMSEKFDFKFTPKEDIYDKLLTGVRKDKPIPMKMIKVKLTDKWQEGGGIVCRDIGRIPYVNEEILVSEERANELVSKGRTVIVGEVVENTTENKPMVENAETVVKSATLEDKPKRRKK